MSLMGTLTKIAVGYVAARGVDRLTSGKGLLGGGAQVKASDQTAATQAQMVSGLSGSGNPMQAMMDQMPGGMDMSAMMGALGGAGNPLGDMMEKMKAGGLDLSSMMGGGADKDAKGLLSGMGDSGAGLAAMLASMGGAAALGGKSVSGLLDQFGATAGAPEMETTAALMLRAMIQAAKADGAIDEAEKAKILETIGEDSDPEDITFVEDQLNARIDVKGLAADTPEALKAQVYSASLMTIRVDTQAEADYLDALAKAMELPEPTVNMLHMQMGIAPLYA
jgi:uncharacterized membrane protein YebE (DUF533 family)